jgi:hypothetical protein
MSVVYICTLSLRLCAVMYFIASTWLTRRWLIPDTLAAAHDHCVLGHVQQLGD